MGELSFSDERYMEICENAYKDFKGSIVEFERAIGTLYVARQTGWKPIYLMHDRKSLSKYEKILGIKFQELVPALGPDAKRSWAWKTLNAAKEKFTNFWAVVRGETKHDVRSPDFLG